MGQGDVCYRSHGRNSFQSRLCLYISVGTNGVLNEIDRNYITFRKEVLSSLTDGTYSSFFGISGLGGVLGATVQSVFPEYGGYTVRHHFNLSKEPREKRTGQYKSFLLYVLTLILLHCCCSDQTACGK